MLTTLPIVGFQPSGGLAPAAGDTLVPLSDRDAESWLKRAEDAAARSDWKLAADTLMRVIDQYGDKTVSLDEGKHFYSAAHCALDQIARWPAEGLATYRLLYDSEVRQRLEAAIKSFDIDALRLIARKYPYTTPGPRAMHLLAAWLLDRLRPGEALDILDRLTAINDDPSLRPEILFQQCVAFALAGQSTAAAEAFAELKALDTKGPPAKSAPDWTQRISSIEHFLKSKDVSESSAQMPIARWPIPGGPPNSTGRMPAIEPAVTPDDYWRDGLPGAERISPRQMNQLIRNTSRPPVWQAVSDGRLLFVTCPEGLIARDLATFDFAWRIVPRSRVRDPQIDRFRLRTGVNDTDNRNRLDELSTRTLRHEYRGAVSTALGLVFIIEQPGTTNELFPSRTGQLAASEVLQINVTPEPNSIRAFEADTGRAVWTIGRSGHVDDELRAAHFYSTPVAVETRGAELLVAPYIQGDDYFLAVLRPDGTIFKRVLLGAGRSYFYPINSVLQPTAFEGTLYIPTGAGLMVALNADDFSLRWLTRYERASITSVTNRRQVVWAGNSVVGSAQPDEWLASPPIVTAGLVLVAAPDSEYLVAYDRKDGREVWAYPRGQLRYLVAADGQRVIAAGKHVIAIDLADGSAAWMFDRRPPSGRPALCGDTLFVPTDDGLIRVNARTGKEIGDPLPSRFALGNLLALDGALYSVTAMDLAKFPDVKQSQQMAQDALERNSDDVAALLRLAGLNVLEKNWNSAVSLLDRAEAHVESAPTNAGPPTSVEPAKGRSARAAEDVRARIAHQRVGILLNVAAEALDRGTKGSPDRAAPSKGRITDRPRRDLLEEAARRAKQPDDVVRAGLAFCELLVDEGKSAEAFQRLMILLRDYGDEPVILEQQLSAMASVLFRERLCGAWRTMNASDRKNAADEARRLIDEDLNDPRAAPLLRLADGLDLRPTGEDTRDFMAHVAWLDLQLGRRALKDGDYEAGVFHLERAAQRLPGSETAAEAILRLAIAYALPGEGLPASPRDALRCLAMLEASTTERSIPGDLRGLDGGAAINTVADLIDRLKKSLPQPPGPEQPELPRVLRSTPTLKLVSESTIASILPADVMSFHDPVHPIDLAEQVLPLRIGREIYGLRNSTSVPDRYFWSLNIDLPEYASAWKSAEQAYEEAAGYCAMAHRIALTASQDSITAVGLTTGRLLWPALSLDRDDDPPPNPPVLSIDNRFIMAPNSSTLIAIPARPNASPIWRRRFIGTKIGRLAIVGEHLVAIDSSGDVVTVINPASGRIQRQFSLTGAALAEGSGAEDGLSDSNETKEEKKADARNRRGRPGSLGRDDRAEAGNAAPVDNANQHVVVVGNMVCRAMQDHVIAKDIATGRTLWDTPLGGLVRGLLPLNTAAPGQIGICYAGSHLAVVDADSGAIQKDFDATGLVLPPIDATLDRPMSPSGRLLIFTKSKEDPPHYMLASFPMGEGERPWQHDLGRFATLNPWMLRASPDYVPVVEYTLTAEAQERWSPIQAFFRGGRIQNSAHLLVLDKTGHRMLLDRAYTLEEGRSETPSLASCLITDVIILDEWVIAISPDGYYVLTSDQREEK